MCNGRHRLQVIIDFFQANMPHQHSPGKWDRKYESLQIRESHTRLCMRLVLMYARQPRPGPRPNRPSNGLLQGTAAIFLMYRYTTCFYVFSKNKVNRCLARYSLRATTTNQPTNRAPNEPARPGPKWTKMPILGHIWSFLQKAAGLTITIVIWIGLSNTQLVNLNQNLFKYEETAMLSKERATHLLNPPLPRSRLAY